MANYEIADHAELLRLEAAEEEMTLRFSATESRKSEWGMPRKLLAAAGAAALLVGGCATAVAASSATAALGQQQQLSARSLLESPEIADACAGNLVRFDTQHEPSEIRAYVASGLKTITRKMHKEDPEAFRQLEALQLSREQHAGVVRVVSHMSNERVQDLGYEVYSTLHGDKSKGREELKQELLQKFGHRAAELRQLRDELVPASLRSSSASQGEAALDLDRTRLFEHFSKEVHTGGYRRLSDASSADHSSAGSMMTPAKAKGMEMKIEDAAGIIGALLEQARIALDATAYIGPAFGKQQPVPWLARSMVGGADFAVETGDCIMRQNDGNNHHYNSVKVAMCPMKYAGALMDLLSGVNNAVGIQNQNLPNDMHAVMAGKPLPAAGQAQQNPSYNYALAATQQHPQMAQNFLVNMMKTHPQQQPQPAAATVPMPGQAGFMAPHHAPVAAPAAAVPAVPAASASAANHHSTFVYN